MPAKLGRRRLGGILATALVALLASLTLPAGASAAAATHFSVVAPASATAGTSFSFTVTALDGTNATDTGYTGTVHFTSPDGQAVLPADSTLTSGVGTFSATLKTAGNQTITATDNFNASITGTSGSINVSPAAATHYAVSAPASAIAGTAFMFTTTARDQFNNTATGYAGTVHFSSTDVNSSLPANSTLTNGVGTFSATLRTAGNRTISATDNVTVSITGTSNTVTVSAGAANHFSVSPPASATAGSAFNFTVTALDLFNNQATGYAGLVGFTSNDGSATLPSNSPLTNGVGTFSATLRTEGIRTITATDTVTTSITGTSPGIAVSTATHFTVTAPATATAGTAFTFTVTALNPNGTVDTAYGGAVRFSSSDGSASLPLDSTLTNGTGTFTATMRTSGSMTITANETGNPSVAGTSGPIVVSPSNAFSFGKLKRNTQNGTATLTVDVPGPGKLTLGGKGVLPQRPVGRSSSVRPRAVSSAGAVKLTVRATGKAKKKLRKTGKARVKVKVTFTPTGGAAASKSETVKLKKVLHS